MILMFTYYTDIQYAGIITDFLQVTVRFHVLDSSRMTFCKHAVNLGTFSGIIAVATPQQPNS
jgi:hypothetical protein